MYRRVIYWFKRDLRVEDNRALKDAIENSKEIIPIFIFIPELLERFKSYDKRLGFIIDCVQNLSDEIKKTGGKLFCYYDNPLKVFSYLIQKYKPQAVYTNRAFSWSAEKIEDSVKTICFEVGIDFKSIKDNFLADIESIPYKKIYSSFYKHWKQRLNLEITKSPEKINTPEIKEPLINDIITLLNFEKNQYWSVSFGIKRLKHFDFKAYETTRNRLDIDGTSKLSPFIRFGTISLRKLYKEAMKKAGEDCQFVKELAWREFWYHIKINFPQFNELEFMEKRRGIKWENNEKFIDAFINAKTGYPIVDAAVTQLKEEGWMHNRARMIVANFLTKDLFVDWKIGEKFFMEYLIDYDEVVNVGNWQWNASVGPDPRPLRIFNPLIQSKKFDPEGLYIKKYLPALKKKPSHFLHDPLNNHLSYFKPIVDHFERAFIIRKLYLKNKT